MPYLSCMGDCEMNLSGGEKEGSGSLWAVAFHGIQLMDNLNITNIVPESLHN